MLLMTLFCGLGFFLGAQTITGIVVDANSGDPLIGATVIEKGTSNGTITDIDGAFEIEVTEAAEAIQISYVGFESKSVDITGQSGTIDLGTISLNASAMGLEEVVVTGVMDIVRDRRTPVAVSTIGTAEIQAKGGNVEFPELMKSTPSIYVANQAGGYGDSEVFTRGFDQTNTAFLLNGQPINGMEDGNMYWSNWSGMTDVANAVQIQRGLGSSKLAISSVGGTVNIIMKSTEQEEGGSVGFLMGNDNYLKATASYNTGLKGKWGASILLTHWQGDGWAEGTKGKGQNYFASIGYKPNDNHEFNFLITGAPQWHDQNFSKPISEYYQGGDEINLKFNSNFGYLNGEYISIRRNYYHKPVANLNWEWDINNKSSLATVAYASWGRGGGTGPYGNGPSPQYFPEALTADGYINWSAVQEYNRSIDGGIGNGGSFTGTGIRASVNNHAWYGLVSKYETLLGSDLTLSLGTDLRTYHGSHFRQLVNLMGLNGFDESDHARFNNHIVSNTYKAAPWSSLFNNAPIEEQIDYSNDETISYAGLFGQLEYTNEKIATFLQGAVSNQSHVRFELYNQTEANEESEKVNNLGYNLKTGLSYSFDQNNTVFFNTGYYLRQPYHDNIYLNFSNTVNPLTVSEKIFGLEAGYKFSSEKFAANLNLYRTSWKDRTTTRTLNQGDELPNGDVLANGGYRNTVQNQLHTGVEIDFIYEIFTRFDLKGYLSVGDWAYEGNNSSKYFDDSQNLQYEDSGINVDGVKVGGPAQTSFGLGVNYNIVESLKLDVDYNHYSSLYSRLGVGNESMELPSYGLLDLGLSYTFSVGNGQYLNLRANVFNALGTEYISYANTAIAASNNDAENWNGVNRENEVMFGKTRTWNISAKYSF